MSTRFAWRASFAVVGIAAGFGGVGPALAQEPVPPPPAAAPPPTSEPSAAPSEPSASEPSASEPSAMEPSPDAPVTLPVPAVSAETPPSPAAVTAEDQAVAQPPPTQAAEPAEKKKQKSGSLDAGGDPWGDLGGADFRGLTFRALLQVRYTSSFAERSQNERVSYRVREEHLAEQGDGWDIGRVFLRASARPAPWVGLKTVFDFGELAHGNTKSTVKQAYVTLEPWAGHVEILTGIFKLPFSILELDPSSKYEFVNNGPINELTGELGFAGRDLGAEVVVAPLRKPKQLKLVFGAFRGHAKDEQDSPLGAVAGRIETRALKGFRFGAGWVEHPRRLVYRRPLETSSKDELPNPPDPLYPRQKTWGAGRALGGDVTFQRWKLNLRAEGLYGDRVDVDQRYHARKFAGGWAIAAYRFRVGGVKQMPALRFELLDADLDRARGLRRELAAAWNVLLSDQLRLVVDVTRTDVDRDSPLLEQPLPLQDPPYFELDRTRVGAQLQLDL